MSQQQSGTRAREEVMNIALTIRDQIVRPDARVSMSWGMRKPVALRSNNVDTLGGLEFSVNGRKFRGRVAVKLMACDLYSIEFSKTLKCIRTVVSSVEGIFCDELMHVIDSFVET